MLWIDDCDLPIAPLVQDGDRSPPLIHQRPDSDCHLQLVLFEVAESAVAGTGDASDAMRGERIEYGYACYIFTSMV